LEGGKYRQCKEEAFALLKNKSLTRCCLAVLSTVQNRFSKSKPKYNECVEHSYGDGENYIQFDGGLSPDNPCYAQLDSTGIFPEKISVCRPSFGYARCLVDCNDVLQLTFKEIAQVIKIVWKP